MSITNRIQQDMVVAMKAQDKDRLSVIRLLKSALQNEAIKQTSGTILTEENEIAVLSRELKQRRDSLKEYEQAGRADFVQSLSFEIEVIQSYLPKQLTEEEIINLVEEAIQATNATQKSQIGLVMANLMPKVKGKADGSLVNRIVQQKLQ